MTPKNQPSPLLEPNALNFISKKPSPVKTRNSIRKRRGSVALPRRRPAEFSRRAGPANEVVNWPAQKEN